MSEGIKDKNIISRIIEELAEEYLESNLSNEQFPTQTQNDRLHRALMIDINQQEHLHCKDDLEAMNKIKMGQFFFKHGKVRPSELDLAIDCFSKAILLAKDNTLLFNAFQNRCRAFLAKEFYHNSFYDSNYCLENATEKVKINEKVMKEISQYHIESCVKIFEKYLNKINKSDKSDWRKMEKWSRIINEYYDRAKLEMTIQIVCYNNQSFKKQLDNLTNNLVQKNPLKTMFAIKPFKHSNVLDVLDTNGKYKGKSCSTGADILFEIPSLFWCIKPSEHCGWCSNYTGHKFLPCSGCDEVIFCNDFCRKMAMDFGGHSKVCRYCWRVAKILGIECYMVYIRSSQTEKIQYNLDHQDRLVNNAYIENIFRLKALALTFIMLRKIYKHSPNSIQLNFQRILDDLRKYYMSPFLKHRLLEPNKNDQNGGDKSHKNQHHHLNKTSSSSYHQLHHRNRSKIMTINNVPMKKSNIIANGLIDFLIEYSTEGNIDRYLKHGQIIYQALTDMVQNETKLILEIE